MERKHIINLRKKAGEETDIGTDVGEEEEEEERKRKDEMYNHSHLDDVLQNTLEKKGEQRIDKTVIDLVVVYTTCPVRKEKNVTSPPPHRAD